LDHLTDAFHLTSDFNYIFTNLFSILESKKSKSLKGIKKFIITRPNGPSLGASVLAGPASPPKTLT